MTFTIGKKLGLAGGALAGLLIVVVVANLLLGKRTAGSADEAAAKAKLTKEESAVFAVRALRTQIAMIQVQQWLTDISATRGAKGFDDGYTEAEANAKIFKTFTGHFRTMYASENDSASLTKITALEKTFDEFYDMGKKMANAYITGGPAVGNPFMEKFDPFAAKMGTSIDLLVKEQLKELDESMGDISLAVKRVKGNTDTTNLVGWICLALAFCFAAILFFVVLRIVGPIRRTAEVAASIAEGDLDQELTVDSNDETGMMAESFQSMISTLQRLNNDVQGLVNAAVEGDLSRRAELQGYGGEYERILSGINKTLDVTLEPVREAGGVLATLAACDLRVRMQGDYKGDHSTIKQNVNLAADALDGSMIEVTNAVQQLEVICAQLSQGSESLGQSATEQAATVEEISVSLHSVSEAAEEASNRAGTATDAAGKAKSSADKGRKRMGVLSEALGDIQGSSTEMAKVIRTIDQIAFQTNVLALNAAVEAARAGEAGKGFAVVAEQVGRLAQRTAEASQQTTELIEGSVSSVGRGVTLGTEVADLLNGIADDAAEAADSVSGISQASAQQASAVGQINTALSQLTTTTQNTAAGAEELSVSADGLSEHADRLGNMVRQYSLSEGDYNGGGQYQLDDRSNSSGYGAPSPHKPKALNPARS
jgi:methyl-accepting chemotaxis protein